MQSINIKLDYYSEGLIGRMAARKKARSGNGGDGKMVRRGRFEEGEKGRRGEEEKRRSLRE